MTEKPDTVSEFLKDYQALVAKHKVDFANYPVYIPDGEGGFKTIIQSTPVDMSNLPQKSTFMAK